jgi:hypothetical protein
MGLPIQNLRSGTAAKRPDPSNLADGQIAINYHEDDPGIFIKGNTGALIKVSPTYVGSTAPNVSPATGGETGTSKGETWLDTSTTPASLKIFDGSNFISSYAFSDIDVDGTYAQSVVVMGSATAIDCSAGNYFTKTVNSSTGITFSFTNVPASKAFAIVVEVTHTNGTISWPSQVKFSAAGTPVLNTGKTHLFVLVTDNGGSRWRASALVDFEN